MPSDTSPNAAAATAAPPASPGDSTPEPLPPRQEAFCHTFVLSGNASVAASKLAGVSPGEMETNVHLCGLMRTFADFSVGIFHNAGKADKSLQIPTKADNAVGFAITPAFAIGLRQGFGRQEALADKRLWPTRGFGRRGRMTTTRGGRFMDNVLTTGAGRA